MNNTGFEIRSARKRVKLSQARLAKELGIVQAVLSQWETGKKTPSEDEYDSTIKMINRIEDEVKKGNLRLNEKRNIHSFKERKNRKPLKSGEDYLHDFIEREKKYSHPGNKKYLESLNTLSLALNNNENANKTSHINAIALFSGCGGFSLGFKAAGINILGHVELNEAARNVYKSNFPDSICLGEDITEIKDDEIHNWKEKFGHVNILFGGPPCQGFSLAGKRNPEDERNILFRDYLNIARIIKPDVLVFENVKVMTSLKNNNGKLFLDDLIESLEEIGYNAKVSELNAMDFGVAQSRQRVVLIAINGSLGISNFEMPHPSHFSSNSLDLLTIDEKAHFTFRDAIGDLKELEMGQEDETDPLHWTITHPDHVVKWLNETPEGKSAHENLNIKNRPSSGYNTTYKRVYWDEPCSTISTNFNMISGSRNVHPKNTRSFSIREAARIQSFPDNFLFFGPWGEVRRMIGNAVPPMLSYKIADHLIKEIFKK